MCSWVNPALAPRAPFWCCSRAALPLSISISISIYTYLYLYPWAVRIRALPFFLVQQGCLRVGVSRCGPAAVVGRGC